MLYQIVALGRLESEGMTRFSVDEESVKGKGAASAAEGCVRRPATMAGIGETGNGGGFV